MKAAFERASGGGAFDFNGNLIGVPTAGRTVQYDELDVEDQAYVRPISLAWAIIGPNVLDVARAQSARAAQAPEPTTSQAGNQVNAAATVAPPAEETTASQLPNSGVGPCDFCLVGPVALGSSVAGVISGVPDAVNYHTYTIEVPTGTETLTVELTADFDLDGAIKFGSEVTNWGDEGDWEYIDVSENTGATFEIALPTPGTWYLDVINFYDGGVANYSVTIR